jgi:hypothetical protein
MTKTQRIRELMKQGKSGTARQLADAVGLDPATGNDVMNHLMSRGEVEVIGYDWAPTGQKVKTFAATSKMKDGKAKYQKKNYGAAGELTGPKGLLCAVIIQAATDAERGVRDAIDWFDSPTYELYMDWLDLNPEMRPAFLESSS